MKRFLAAMMVLLLVVCFCTTALAADTTGKITVGTPVKGQTYTIYRLAELESFSGSSYSYKPTEQWAAFFTDRSEFTITDDGYLILADGVSLTAAQTEQLAKDARAYALGTGADAVDTKTAGDGDVVFEGLALGYYLLDSSLGTLCSLDTTDTEVTINEKNAEPSLNKLVQEDSDGSWGISNHADFYQTVNFKSTITAQAGAQKYVLHDVMTGLTLVEGSVAVAKADGTAVAASNYEVLTEDVDGESFRVVFQQSFCDTLTANEQLVVTYSAVLDENSTVAGDGNPNRTWLTYGDSGKTSEHVTVTYVYEFDIAKTDASGALLSGAEFALYPTATGGDRIGVVQEADGSYRLAKDGEVGQTIVVNGVTTITGLDGETTYYLEETKAPAGYNKLTARTPVVLEESSLKATVNDGAYTPKTGVQVVNKTGAALPETGGTGTAVFVAVGMLLVLGTGVLLVTKKRAGNME